MADWSTPQLSSTYTVFRQALNDRLVDAALMFDSASTSATNIPSGAKRWNSTSSKFEKYNGSTWSDLSSLYAIDISGNAATATTATTANGLAAGVAIANIGAAGLSYGHIQNISATKRLLGRNSTGAGSAEELTATQLLDWVGTPAQGQIAYRGASAWKLLAPGSATQVLISGGTGVNPSWATLKTTMQPISASVANNSLTLTLSPTMLDFRSSTLSSGAVNTRVIGGAISLVVPAGATLGTVNATAARLVILAIDNAGTVELAVTNLTGAPSPNNNPLISTTAISSAADNIGVIYSATARANVPYQIVGFIDITEATAGTWATAPALVQGWGGQQLSGRKWQDLTASRAIGITYYNTTGDNISVLVVCNTTTGNYFGYMVNGVGHTTIGVANSFTPLTFDVPPMASYSITQSTTATLSRWNELR